MEQFTINANNKINDFSVALNPAAPAPAQSKASNSIDQFKALKDIKNDKLTK